MKVPKARKLPSGTWFIQMRLGGESVSVSANTEKECVRKAEMAKAEYRNGLRIKKADREEVTVTQAIDRFIAKRQNVLSPSTIKAYRSIQKHRFQSIMQKSIHSNFDWQQLVDYEASLKNAKTVKNCYVFIRSVFKDNKIDVPEVKMPQIVPNKHPYLTWEQIPVFLDAIYGDKFETLCLLGLHSLRRSEMMALSKPLSFSNGIIHVNGASVIDVNKKIVKRKENKNETSKRDIPIMIPRLQELIDKAENGAMFTCYPTSLYNHINMICEKNGLPKIGVHGLRHSFASLARHVGLSEQETMEIGGWADRNTMHNIYTHLDKVDRTKATNKMADFYKNANETTNKK